MNATPPQHTTDAATEGDPTIHVDQLGDGDPELAIVGAIHGDEPCGAHAIEAVLAEDPPVDQPVMCVIAHEQALAQNVRYIDTDLNRVFPGDHTADAYERRLAAALLSELAGCRTLVLHSTQSTARPFAIVPKIGPLTETICPHLSVDALVEAGSCVGTALGSVIDAIEVECGRQGTQQAAKTAECIVRGFLRATGALPVTSEPSKQALPVFRLQHKIPKPPADAYTVHATNFERVVEGETYATIDDTPLIAEEPFYPVLMSPDGYESQFGYAAELADPLSGEYAEISREKAHDE